MERFHFKVVSSFDLTDVQYDSAIDDNAPAGGYFSQIACEEMGEKFIKDKGLNDYEFYVNVYSVKEIPAWAKIGDSEPQFHEHPPKSLTREQAGIC